MMPRSIAASWRRLAGAVLLALALGGGLAAVFQTLLAPGEAGDDEEAESTVGPPARVTVKDGMTVLTLSAADRRNSGIETARPDPPPARATIVAFGTVLDAAPLSDLSNRYLEAETQVQTAVARLAVSRAAFERAKILHKDQQNISTAQLQGAEGSFEVDRAALVAAQFRLTSVAAAAQQAWGGVLGAAIIDRAPLLTRLIERRDYLIRVTLPPGAAMTARLDTGIARLNGETEMPLTFISAATTTDPRLQGISYFYRAAAEGAALPGSNLLVQLPVSPVPRGVVVPESAIVWLQGKAWIYLGAGSNTFVRREIAPERPGPDGGYIVTDLPADAEIAVRGVQMLLSEEFRAQTPIQD